MKRLKMTSLFLALSGVIGASPAAASGFDNMQIGSTDLLFDPAKFAVEFGATYINRNVEYQISNAQYSAKGKLGGLEWDKLEKNIDGAQRVNVTPDVWNYQIAAKADLHEYLSCFARINNPGTILEEAPEDWGGRFSMIKTELTSFGFDAMCAVKLALGGGHQMRLIGGGKYVEANIGVLKYSDMGLPGQTASLSTVNLSGSGYGWRAGIAYEFPEYAIRASLIYDDAVSVDLTGDLIPGPAKPVPVIATVDMPRAVEFRVQSGIAPRWLAFAGVKWTNWASLDKLTVNYAVQEGVDISRYFGFSDGWTVTAGIGHQLTEKIQVGGSLTWDQGIGGSYSDTYQFGLGGSYKINDNVSFSLGGAAIYKTGVNNTLVSSSTDITDPDYPDGEYIALTDQFDLKYDASLNFAIGGKLKLSF